MTDFTDHPFYTERTLVKTAGIAEALLSLNQAEVEWAENNLDYYDKLKCGSGRMPDEHLAEIKRVAARLVGL